MSPLPCSGSHIHMHTLCAIYIYISYFAHLSLSHGLSFPSMTLVCWKLTHGFKFNSGILCHLPSPRGGYPRWMKSQVSVHSPPHVSSFLRKIFLCVYEYFTYMHAYGPYACLLDSPELWLWMIVSHHVSAGIEPRSLNHRIISPCPFNSGVSSLSHLPSLS